MTNINLDHGNESNDSIENNPHDQHVEMASNDTHETSDYQGLSNRIGTPTYIDLFICNSTLKKGDFFYHL